MDAVKTGELIAAARKEKNLTQRQLADALHVSDRTVSKWERGAGFPDLALLEPLADALELAVTDLLHGEKQSGGEADREVRYAMAVIRQRMAARLRRNAWNICWTIGSLAVFLFLVYSMVAHSLILNKDFYLQKEAGVYVDGVRVEDTMVTFDGERNPLEHDSFFGHIYIDYIDKTCREQVYAGIAFTGEGQRISWNGYGELGFVDMEWYCYVSSNMHAFAFQMEDGTIVASDDYMAELMALDGYYPLVEAGCHYY